MAFEKSVALKDCLYSYEVNPNVKKFTLKDNTFAEKNVGNFELTRLLEEFPKGGKGFLFKINITDKSGLRLVNIFKSEDQKIIQQKFYFLMDSLVEREIFTKTEQ